MSRRRLGALLTAALLASGGLAAVAGARTVVPRDVADTPPYWVTALPSSDLDFGAFAGENWEGRPRSISASWRVPRLMRGSSQGVAGTWIGIEAPSTGSTNNGPFIQVGINESRARLGRRSFDDYYAFFSDTALHFHPIPLFQVHPGNRLSASLKLRDHVWTVWIRDKSTGHGAHLRTRQDGHGAFNQAEWLQEDVTNGLTDKPYPYPSLSTVRFSALEVNGRTPKPGVLEAAWMNEQGAFLGPGTVVGDAFSDVPETIAPDGADFLQAVIPRDVVLDWFDGQLDGWAPATPAVETGAERSALEQALTQADAQLSAVTWSAAVQPLIDTFVADDQSQLAYLADPPAASTGAIRRWIAGWYKLSAADAILGRIRRLLGLPLNFPDPT